MPARSILASAATLIPLALAAPPAAAHAGGLLAAPPPHAPPGVCFARVRQGARWTAPGPIRAQWRLRPGASGPVWCWVSEAGAPPVLLHPERHGWVRVSCRPARRVRVAVPHRPARPRPPPVRVVAPPVSCCTLPTSPPPPPVVTVAAPAPPTPPRSPWLGWSGKSLY